MVDHFTKYGWIVPLKDKKAENILIAFKKWVTTHNVPLSLQTDNGTEFKNSLLTEFCKQMKIKQIFGTPYNPEHHCWGIQSDCSRFPDKGQRSSKRKV